VYPPTYPTEVEYTPGNLQNIFSVPQKQPVAKTHVFMFEGNDLIEFPFCVEHRVLINKQMM
jgi:hypothetical protein